MILKLAVFSPARRSWRAAFTLLIGMVVLAQAGLIGVPQKAYAVGLNWPSNQQFPSFSSISTLDVIDLSTSANNTDERRILFSTLEGLVNRTQPRMYFLDTFLEGKNYWLDKLTGVTKTTVTNPFSLITKYRSEIQGIVIYDPSQEHTRNLATTIAGVRDAIVASPALAATLNASPYNLPTLVDLRTANGGGGFTSKIQVYQYAYDNYWTQTTRRILIGLQPFKTSNLRDYAVALKAMVVWLDPRVPEEAVLVDLFFQGMPANSPYLGWWEQENAGVAAGSDHGIPTFAADNLDNGTVWGGTSRTINVQSIPTTPTLQNKIYVMMVMSDGDNVQENQHLTPVKWADSRRGQVPITWTLSPADVDIQPFFLNYYWQTATANDSIVSGPSGLGYMYPSNWSSDRLNTYLDTSNAYLQAAGMRVITIWNNGQPYSSEVAAAYVQRIPSLLGVTLQECCTGIWNNAIPAIEFIQGYGQNQGDLVNAINNGSGGWDGNSARFIAVQGDANQDAITPTAFYNVQQSFAGNGNYVFVRGDHFFQLYSQALGLSGGPGDTTLDYPFTSNAQGWTGSTAGGYYDSAQWTGTLGNPSGSLVLDGSDLGSPNGNPNATFFHTISLPSTAQNFSFDTRSTDSAHGGQLRVRLVDASRNSHTLFDWETYRSGTWASRSTSVAAYAGQTVTIYFEQNDSGPGDGEKRWVDNVHISTSGGGGTTVFSTGLESGQPQPNWTNSVETVNGGLSNVGGYCCGLTVPELATRNETTHNGSTALMYSGLDNSAASSYAYMKVFDVNVTVASNTTLNYWIYPQSSAQANNVIGNNSTCVAIDMVFADGSNLRDSGINATNGYRLHPAFQCGHSTLNQWNQVTANLGSLNGRVIDRIIVAYDQPGNTGGYRGYVDDISLTNGAPNVASLPQFTPSVTTTPTPSRPDTIGIYKDGVFSLRNSNTSGVADLTVVFGGDPSDYPVTGDWNGDGVDTIGVYRTKSGTMLLSDSNLYPITSYAFTFGNPNDVPFAGRWSTNMKHDGIGVYRASNGIAYQKISLETGNSDYLAVFGNPGDQAVVGDWNGDGLDSLGVYRQGNWYLTNNSQPNGVVMSDLNFAWTVGDGHIVAGDWNGDRISHVGAFEATRTVFALHSTNVSKARDNLLVFGKAGGIPLAGKWTTSNSQNLAGIISNGVGTFVNSGEGGAD